MRAVSDSPSSRKMNAVRSGVFDARYWRRSMSDENLRDTDDADSKRIKARFLLDRTVFQTGCSGGDKHRRSDRLVFWYGYPRVGKERGHHCSAVVGMGQVADQLAHGEVENAEAKWTENGCVVNIVSRFGSSN